jgi:exonuclease SbcC
MRPLRLSLRNFTAFRDEQVIDFTDLDLFALSGPIGSGKSSILDAMTYALYGRVERVGDEPKYLVSQGQPRMAVQFDFRVGNDEFRVMRSTGATGSSKVLLERCVDGEYKTFGDGADQIRWVNKAIIDLVGLDYDAFTRSVVLPQGKFAQFLVGDPLTRRKILTELLGLELFERMAKRSNEIANEAKSSADAIQALLDRTYADVSVEKLTEVRAAQAEAAALMASRERAHRKLVLVTDRARELAVSVDRVARSAGTILDLATKFEDHSRTLELRVRQLRTEDEEIAAARIELEKATDALDGAQADLSKAEEQWGKRETLVSVRERVARLGEAIAEAEESAASLRDADKQLTSASDEAAAAERAYQDAQKRATRSSADLIKKRKRYDDAHRHDLVGALVADLNPGSPCPVCDRPLESLPEVDGEALNAVKRNLRQAEEDDRQTQKELADAHSARLLASRAVETATGDRARCEKESQRRAQAAKRLAAEIAEAFGGELPADPMVEIERRIDELDDLTAALSDARDRHGEAQRTVDECQAGVDRARAEIEFVRVAIEESGLEKAVAEALAAAPIDAANGSMSARSPRDPAGLQHHAVSVARDLNDLGRKLEKHLTRLSEQQADLEQEALAMLPEDAPAAHSMQDALASMTSLLRAATSEEMRLSIAAERLEEDLTKKSQLQADAATKKREHELYKVLGRDLQRNRIVDYLQAEALKALALFASDRLHDLSGGRYRLAFQNEGFCVVDAWNGEERRRVNTLSGGETFLASLALALALSEQVQLLAVTERQRLESLFLDEGFGSLDPETLEIVVAAIEQLGGEDRLVGVITHVTDVADRLPTRIEVVKSPRGSTLLPRTNSSDALLAGAE